MARIALRLSAATIRSGKAWFAFQAMVVAVIVAGGLVAATAATALDRQDDRLARRQNPKAADRSAGAPVLWWSPSNSQSLPGGRSMAIVSMAAEDPGAPLPPGLSRHLAEGEVAMSPALGVLLADGTIDEAWLGGTPVEMIGRAGLHDPDELLLYEGRDATSLAQLGFATPLSGTIEAQLRQSGGGQPTAPVDAVAAAVAALAALPLLALVRSAALADGERRRRRMDALGLVGMTRSQLRTVAGCEALLLTVAGTTVGLAVVNVALRSAEVIRVGPYALFAADLIPSVGRQVVAAAVVAVVSTTVASAALVSAHLADGRVAARGRGTARSAALVAAFLSGLVLAAVAGSLPPEPLSSRLVLFAGAALLTGAAISGQRDLMRWVGRPRDGDGFGAVLWRADLRTTADSRARPFAPIVLAGFVAALAAVAYPSAAPAQTSSRAQLATPNVSINLPSQPTAAEAIDRLSRDPAVRSVLPVTLGPGLDRTIHGDAADVAAAFDLDCPPPCEGLSQAQLDQMFNITAHSQDVDAAHPMPVTEVVVNMGADSSEALGRLSSQARDAFPGATLLARQLRGQSSTLGTFSSQNLQSVGLIATAMAIAGVVSALVFSRAHTRARRFSLKHLNVTGMTFGQAALTVTTHLISAAAIAMTSGIAAGLLCGVAYGIGGSLRLRAEVAPLASLTGAVVIGTALVAASAAAGLKPLLARTSVTLE